MSFEEQASSSALSLIDVLESPAHRRTRVFAAAAGALVTIAMWIVHLYYIDLFTLFSQMRGWAKLLLGIFLAPPFVLAFTLGSFIYAPAVESKETDEPGLMSTYLYQERSSRRWKLLIVAGLLAGVNFVGMLATSGM
jgi:hypothetical protein